MRSSDNMQWPPITEVLAYYVIDGFIPTPRSRWTKLRCPFHEEKQASATYNVEKNFFNCFGCGVKGTALQLIMDREGVTYAEACSLAEQRHGSGDSVLPADHSPGDGLFSSTRDRPGRGKQVPPGGRRKTMFGT